MLMHSRDFHSSKPDEHEFAILLQYKNESIVLTMVRLKNWKQTVCTSIPTKWIRPEMKAVLKYGDNLGWNWSLVIIITMIPLKFIKPGLPQFLQSSGILANFINLIRYKYGESVRQKCKMKLFVKILDSLWPNEKSLTVCFEKKQSTEYLLFLT